MEVKYEEKIKLCRLCFESYDLEAVDDDKKENLKSLLLELGISISKKLDVCNNCVDNVRMCCAFKSSCLNTENYVTSFVSKDKNKVDIKEIYLNRSKKDDVITFDDHDTVCRLCLRMRDRNLCIDLSEEAKDTTLLMIMLKQYFPTVDLNITFNPTICTSCHKSLQTYFDLTKSCVDLKTWYEFETTNNRSDNIVQLTTKDALKGENDYVDYSIAERNIHKGSCDRNNQYPATEGHKLNIKSEEIDIKGDNMELESARRSTENNTSINQCPHCSYQSKTKSNLRNHMVVHTEALKHKCTDCTFTTKHQKSLHRHMMNHNSKATTHRCRVCSFETKHRFNLHNYRIVHKSNSRDTTHKCTDCDFVTTPLHSRRSHMLVHETTEELTMNKCHLCEYQTKSKYDLKKHLVVHKDKSELTVHKCTTCNFETIRKQTLRRHMVTHKSASEVPMHKCTECSFESKHQLSLRNHRIVHQKGPDLKVHKCTECSFETKYRHSLTYHLSKHRTSSDVAMHECTECSFRSKYQQSLHRHMVAHKSESEATVYKCTECSYVTKHKDYINKHLVVHKSDTELPVYVCDKCTFKTRRKDSIQRHLGKHRKEVGGELMRVKDEVQGCSSAAQE